MVRHPLPLGAPGRQTITYGSDSPLRSAASSERAERIVISSVPAAEPGPNAEAGPEAGPAPGPELPEWHCSGGERVLNARDRCGYVLLLPRGYDG